MRALLQCVSALTTALACFGASLNAQADPNNAFLNTVREFADPAYSQSDAGLLIYPSEPGADPVISQASAQPGIVYVPYPEPVYVTEPVTNYVRVGAHQSGAWARTHRSPPIGNTPAIRPETPHHPETPNNRRG